MIQRTALLVFLAGCFVFCGPAQAVEVDMGGNKFNAKVTVYDDGTVQTESAEKEVPVEGEGKKRLKLKERDGKLVVVDQAGTEIAADPTSRKLKKKQRLIDEIRDPSKRQEEAAAGTKPQAAAAQTDAAQEAAVREDRAKQEKAAHLKEKIAAAKEEKAVAAKKRAAELKEKQEAARLEREAKKKERLEKLEQQKAAKPGSAKMN